jgi:hypothetical protein
VEVPAELYGPFGALAALTVGWVMLIRGDLVPGWLYRQEREQRAKAEAQAIENAKSLSVLAATVMKK